MAREIVLDTETTGLEAHNGDRVIEIACVELIDLVRTDKNYHVYINPERDIPDSAFRVHGISAEMVADKPLFAEIAEGFLEFIGDDPLIAHNAEFDMRFLNMELERCGRPALAMTRVIDTLTLARKKFPGQSNSLDALCNRLGVDRSARVKHGALIDSEILGDVYLELMGGRQRAMALAVEQKIETRSVVAGLIAERTGASPHLLTAEEEAAHHAFMGKFKTPPLWRLYQDGD